jgi:hypothetical protein
VKYSPLPTSVERAIYRFCEDLSTPRSLSVMKMIEFGEWDQLVSLKVDPLQYQDAHTYWLDASVSALLRKTEDLPTTFDRRSKAVENFWSGERDCARANARLYPFVEEFRWGSIPIGTSDAAVLKFFQTVRSKVKEVLGHCPSIQKVEGRFGPGASFGDRGQMTTVPDKMSSHPTLTWNAWGSLFPWARTAWANACYTAYSKRVPQLIDGNRFSAVPKDCQKNRGIAIEPSINLFYQLGYGSVIRRRLLRLGIDLDHGQEKHKLIACEASKTGLLATLDLKNASDTVSRRLVELLLPREWFRALSSLRCEKTLLDGKWVLLEKFSSMGNGFTFELETVIFLCICWALDPEMDPGSNLFTFGDDIILPTKFAQGAIGALEFCGFTINKDKSFWSGKFRESCGGDFFDGVDVRPHFIDSLPVEPADYISLLNGIRRLSGSFCEPERYRSCMRFWHSILGCLPSEIQRCRGPEVLGDICIHDEPRSYAFRRWRSSIGYIRCFRPHRLRRYGWEHFRPDVVLATAVYGLGDGRRRVSGPDSHDHFDSGGVIPRKPILSYKLGWVTMS